MKRKSVRAGDKVSICRTVTGEDVEAFGELSRDHNPVHFDDGYAARTIYGRRIAHGLVSAALVSGALTKLMGPGNVLLTLNLEFKNPVYVGDEMLCQLTVVQKDRRHVTTFEIEIRNSDSKLVVEGTATSMRTGGA